MAMHFDRWEKDPFFSAAEEVQESADRMDSTYRTWKHALKDTSHSWNLEDLTRDLRAALGTAKWQLEEFERAVKASYKKNFVDEAKDRHHQFILAMEEKVSVVENMLLKMSASDGKTPPQWVRLDEGERDEFALFLAGPSVSGDKLDIRVVGDGNEQPNPHGRITKPVASPLKNKSYASGLHLMDGKHVPGHRRTASASADIGSWDISVYEDKNKCGSSKRWAEPPPQRVPSYSGFISAAVEAAPKLMLPKNGFRKWKAAERQQDDDIALLSPQELSQKGMSSYCEKPKRCLNTGDDCCNKQLYGWYGAVQRMLQRSQYQVQYSRPLQLTFWTVLLLFSIVLFVLRAI